MNGDYRRDYRREIMNGDYRRERLKEERMTPYSRCQGLYFIQPHTWPFLEKNEP